MIPPPSTLRHGLRGEIPRMKTHIMPAEVITPENAKDFYFPDSIY